MLRVELRRVKRVVPEACLVRRRKDGAVGRRITRRGHQGPELVAAVHRDAGIIGVGLVLAARDAWRVGAAGEVALGVLVDVDLLAPHISLVQVKNEKREVERGGDVCQDAGVT